MYVRRQCVVATSLKSRVLQARESSGDEADASRTMVSEAFANALKAKVAAELSANAAAVEESLNAEEQHKEEVSKEENDDDPDTDTVEERENNEIEPLSPGELPLIVDRKCHHYFY